MAALVMPSCQAPEGGGSHHVRRQQRRQQRRTHAVYESLAALPSESKEEDSESLGSSYNSVSHDGDGEDGGGEGRRHLCYRHAEGLLLPPAPAATPPPSIRATRVIVLVSVCVCGSGCDICARKQLVCLYMCRSISVNGGMTVTRLREQLRSRRSKMSGDDVEYEVTHGDTFRYDVIHGIIWYHMIPGDTKWYQQASIWYRPV
uniref:Uncharacterized protein n=1 Tax=Oryza brachyantha TaxID=4533 RepID=J3MNE9_ORYBR